MKLIPYDARNLTVRKGYKKSENLRILEEFVESGMECAKVEGYTQKNALICSSSLSSSIRNYNMGGVIARTRNGEVFLIKVSEEK